MFRISDAPNTSRRVIGTADLDRAITTGPTRRRHLNKGWAVGLATIGLALTVTAAPAESTTRPRSPAAPALHWAACGSGFQCARAVVPLDYDHPNGATISLALIQLPATDRRHRIGSLLVNPGGPGTSGVDRVREGARRVLAPALRSRFDVVGFDPRGVGASSPIRCFPNAAAQARFFAGVPLFPLFPVGRTEQVAYVAKMAELGGICLRRNAAIMQHMSTGNVARDLDLLRQALGDRRLTFYGASYGTYLGNVYANLFPRRVRSLVLDSVVDPVAWATGRGNGFRSPLFLRERSDKGAHETLNRFLQLCDRAGPRCGFSSGDPSSKLTRLLARARRAPIIITTPQGPLPVSYAEIVGLTLADLFDPDTWAELAGTLQALLEASQPGGAPAVAHRVPAAARAVGGGYDNRLEALLSVACSDSNHPHDPFVWTGAAAGADHRFGPFGSPWAYETEPCATWPARDRDRYLGPFTHRTAPVLLIGTRFDPASWFGNAQTVARELPGRRLLTLDGWGHVALGRSSCVSDHVARYVLSGELPPPGAVCQPDEHPFH